MRKYINGKLQEVISEKVHSKTCEHNKFVEVTKLDSDKGVLTVKYRHCPKCDRYISGDKYNLSIDHY